MRCAIGRRGGEDDHDNVFGARDGCEGFRRAPSNDLESWALKAARVTTATRSSWEIVAKALVDHLVQVGRSAPPRWAKGA